MCSFTTPKPHHVTERELFAVETSARRTFGSTSSIDTTFSVSKPEICCGRVRSTFAKLARGALLSAGGLHSLVAKHGRGGRAGLLALVRGAHNQELPFMRCAELRKTGSELSSPQQCLPSGRLQGELIVRPAAHCPFLSRSGSLK